NSCGSSANRMSMPSETGRPSAPTVVDTTGFAIDIASKIFNRVPPPMRNGTTTQAARARYGLTSGTAPVTVILGSDRDNANNLEPGLRPTTLRVTFSNTIEILGSIASAK